MLEVEEGGCSWKRAIWAELQEEWIMDELP